LSVNKSFRNFTYKTTDLKGQNGKPDHLHPHIEKQIGKFKKKNPPADVFVREILQGNKAWLSRAITLVESTAPDDRHLASEIIRRLLPHSGNSFRIGITGVPGVGKSTFIDRLGTAYIHKGHKVAVLAIDPSSAINKGSILGDKTRMENLIKEENAFIRPSPAGNFLGGVARKTRESIILCEAAGYDRILVETVGVGQSEIYVRYITDMFLLLKLPGAGDELQGIKRGIMEMADMIIINKADRLMKEEARKAVNIFKNALQYFTFRDTNNIDVMAVSSFSSADIQRVLEKIEHFRDKLIRSGQWENQRREQLIFWFEEGLLELFKNRFRSDKELLHEKTRLAEAVKQKKITPFEAAETLWALFLDKLKKE